MQIIMFHLNADMIELKGQSLCLFQGNAGGGCFVSDKDIILRSINSRLEFLTII